MDLYLTALGLMGIASALLIGIFALIEMHRTTKASLQGIQELLQASSQNRQTLEELIRFSQEERRRSEATVTMAEATLRELLELRRQGPQVH